MISKSLLKLAGWHFEGPILTKILLDDYTKLIITKSYPGGHRIERYPDSHYVGDPTERLSVEGQE